MDHLEEKWQLLSLLEEESTEIHCNEDDMIEEINQSALCLVGKLHSEQLIKKMIIQSKINKIWKLTHLCTFHDISSNLFLLQFAPLEDKNKVLSETP